MDFQPGHKYHVYNQGNNRIIVYYSDDDYRLFLKKMRKALLPHSSILAWCLMPNHFHWLIHINDDYELKYDSNERTKKLNKLNRDIGNLLSSYTQSLNAKIGRTGSLFRKRTKAKALDGVAIYEENFAVNCFLYIHQNPIRAGLVNKLEDWKYSSFIDYIGFRNGDLCNTNLAKSMFNLPDDMKDFYRLSYQTIPERIHKKLL